jgi:uncharacterized protein YggU (UPF0235/DUF167 family)
MLAELVEDGRYKAVIERCGSEPLPEEVLQFVHRLPRLFDRVVGAEAEERREERRLSPKRAARAAAEEVRRQRDLAAPTRSMVLKNQELELSDIIRQAPRQIDVRVWVRPGRDLTAWAGETHDGLPVVDVRGAAGDRRAAQQTAAALARHYGAAPRDVELLEGFASQRKTFRITLRQKA